MPCPKPRYPCTHSDHRVLAPRCRPRSKAACHRRCSSSPPSSQVSTAALVLLRSRSSCLTLFRHRATFSVPCCCASHCPFPCACRHIGPEPSSAATPRSSPRRWSSTTSRFRRRCLGWVPRRTVLPTSPASLAEPRRLPAMPRRRAVVPCERPGYALRPPCTLGRCPRAVVGHACYASRHAGPVAGAVKALCSWAMSGAGPCGFIIF
jgi:hypothetical protein